MTAEVDVERWQRDPVAFIREVLRDPETGRPFELYPAQERFFRAALTPGQDGALPYPELIYSGPKKLGKTATAAMCLLYVVVVLGGPFAEGYTVANDLEQSVGRVFQAAARMVEASPVLRRAKITSNRIEFGSTGATITAIASDYAGAAGANPTISVFDELWAYVSERSQRLWDEMIPVPTRKVSVRLTVTYAGFEGESRLLEGLYRRGLEGRVIGTDLRAQPGLLMYWTHLPAAPWQTVKWLEQMRSQLRPQAFRRMIENHFASGEEAFVPISWWDGATTSSPVISDRRLQVVLGVDAGLKRDSAAVVACTNAGGKVRMVAHRIHVPGREPLDLEDTLEQTIREFAGRFNVRRVLYDPWQFARSAQTLSKAGLPMEEFPQSVPNISAASVNLYELLKGSNLIAYPDADIRLALQRAVAVETARGLKITKEKGSHRIDAVVALAMAALGAVRELTGATSISDLSRFAEANLALGTSLDSRSTTTGGYASLVAGSWSGRDRLREVNG